MNSGIHATILRIRAAKSPVRLGMTEKRCREP
jgi:hypothetical protein